jgi:beta-glucanase (GH16 family)
MKHILVFILLIECTFNCFGQTVSNDPHWELVWEDHFNSFDTNRWLKLDYAEHNFEPQIYMKNMVSIAGSNLIIKMDDQLTYCPDNPVAVIGAAGKCENKWYSYTSGWVETKPSQNVQYGLIEASIKLPYGYGFWTAFWTFIGQGVGGSNAAEIDIFEMLGQLPPDIITTCIHLAYGSNQPNYYEEAYMGNYANVYHNYAVAWSPLKIVWYVDGKPIRITTNHGIVDPSRIILNFAILKDFLPNSSTPFPSEMAIDYIKVHQLKNDCNTNLSACNFDFDNIDFRVKKNILIGGNGCRNSIPTDKKVFLRATDSFRIEGAFTVPFGSTLFVDVNPCH